MQRKTVCSRDVTINLADGLHARPATKLVEVARGFACQVLIRKGDRTADGTSVLDVLTLAAECGSVLNLETRGERAEEALDALVELFARNFELESE